MQMPLPEVVSNPRPAVSAGGDEGGVIAPSAACVNSRIVAINGSDASY